MMLDFSARSRDQHLAAGRYGRAFPPGWRVYFSSAQQGIDKLKSSLSLLPMGTVAPKGVGTMKANQSELVSFGSVVELR